MKLIARACLFVALLAASWPAAAQAYPNVAPNCVLGRLGSGNSGPPQCIPLSLVQSGITPYTAPTHQWLNALTGGGLTSSQPSLSDLSAGTLAGSNSFSGPNQFTGPVTFSGNIGIIGDVNGNPIFTGFPVFNNPVAPSSGGTGASLSPSNGGIVYSGASAFAVLPGTSTANQCLLSGANAAPLWGPCPTFTGSGTYTGNNTWTGNSTFSGAIYYVNGIPYCQPRGEGAKFDNSTDDTASWTACLTILKALSSGSGGGVIDVRGPFAASCLKSGFVLDGTGYGSFHIIGSGYANTIASACGTDVTPITIQNCSGCSIEGIEIEGKGLPNDATFGASHPAFYAYNDPALIMRDVYAYYGTIPISLNAVNNCVMSNVGGHYGYGTANLYMISTDGCNVYDNGYDGNPPQLGSVAGLGPIPASMSGLPAAWQSSHAYGAAITAAIAASNGSEPSGLGELHVTAIASGNLTLNEQLVGTGVNATTQIICRLTGAGGTCTTFSSATGYYLVSVSQTVSSESMTAIGDIVSTGGYYIQLATNGTSGGSAPTLKNFGTNITDNTAVWQLYDPVGHTLILLDSGASENTFNNFDITGFSTYDVLFADSLSTGGPTNDVFTGNTLGGVPFSAMFYAQYGSRLAISNLHTNDPAIASASAFAFGSGWNGYARVRGVHYNEGNLGGTGNGTFIAFSGGKGNLAEGNTAFGGDGISVAAGVTDFNILGNVLENANASVTVLSGASDYYNIVNNIVHGVAVSDSGSGSHKTVSGNN